MPGRRLPALAAIALLAAPSAAADTAQVERTFLERTAIAAADASCGLFSDGERLALRSGLYQAEGELLRANYTPARLESLSAEVRAHARALGCDHPSVVEVAATIRSSYRQFTKTNFLQYAAGNSSWGASRSEHDAWAVMQTDATTGIIIGLRRGEEFEDLVFAVGVPADGRAPSSAQLFVRDVKKMREPWLGPIFGAATLAPAPRSISRPEWAGEMEEDEDFDRRALLHLHLLQDSHRPAGAARPARGGPDRTDALASGESQGAGEGRIRGWRSSRRARLRPDSQTRIDRPGRARRALTLRD